MKKFMKKFCYTTLFSIILLFENITCYAADITYNTLNTTELQTTYSDYSIEYELHEMGSSVLMELKNQKSDYESLLEETHNTDEQNQLIELINATQELIDTYQT